MIEYTCKNIVFHFNKKHLEDSTIPMWVLKTAGNSFYVNHVTCEIPWTTKETPDNSHTKGSIKLKECLLTIDEENNAILTKLTMLDKIRLRNQKLGNTRILINNHSELLKGLKLNEFKTSKLKPIVGVCRTEWYICDLLDKNALTIASLKYSKDFRILKPNEAYYQQYDKDDEFLYETPIEEELDE